eukprot:TRINITY_DN26458_c0_g1_i3.p1 TRINITY_DN26458_c0_g1~~TRINITY_DN26458_c0_g1_i3.p1  ORF type:complete len:365 (+),score=49.72 TRINITY_DN26458_c0_g1_i3:70-1164(+)
MQPVDGEASTDSTKEVRLSKFSKFVPATGVEQKPVEISRNVDLHFHFFSISDIDTASETFRVRMYVRATWVEPTLVPGQPLPEDVWKPELMYMNVASPPVIEYESLDEFSELAPGEGKGVVLQWKSRIFATFREKFELEAFPFDTQALSIVVSTKQRKTNLLEDDKKSVLRDEYSVLPEWTVSGPFVAPVKSYHSTLRVSLLAARRWPYYAINLYFPLWALTCLCFPVFAVEAADIGTRIELTLAIVLASIAYKLTLAQTLPRISYVTMADAYVLGSFAFTCVVVVGMAYTSVAVVENETARQKLDVAVRNSFAVVFIVGNISYFLTMEWMRRKSLHDHAMEIVSAGGVQQAASVNGVQCNGFQ